MAEPRFLAGKKSLSSLFSKESNYGFLCPASSKGGDKFCGALRKELIPENTIKLMEESFQLKCLIFCVLWIVEKKPVHRNTVNTSQNVLPRMPLQ